MNNYVIILVYWIVISIISAAVTVKDKKAAQNHRWRTPEATLMILGLLGGAEAMYITMKKIRHKTKHSKFMIGLPLEIILHIALIIAYIILTK